MKIISLQENLKKGISVVSHITSKNVNLPILNNILIKADEGNIDLIATNLEIGIIHSVRGKIEKPGEITIDAKIINEYINFLPQEKITFDVKDENIKIECSNYKTKIKGESAKEFPLLPEIEENNIINISLIEFKKALSQVVFAVSKSESRVELSGILFEFSDNKLFMVATDSYRLAEKTVDINIEKNKNLDENNKIIIPAKTAQEVLRIASNLSDDLDSSEKKVKLYINENQIVFELDDSKIISRLISGQYPDYKQIIPQKKETEIIVSRQELIRAIKASSIFSKSGINDINISVNAEKKEIIISSLSTQTGESVINLNGEIKGKNNDITLNFRYLLDGLNNIDSDNIRLFIVDNNTPCMIKNEKEDSYLYIVMPIKQ
ncbi:MAG TPA: DNA polymerase III subunit beta [Patescibacteria group bacterium]|nr:DNA polymerase III subunit beta [Patescibacteria group bacterium]